jgi:hypothetical protein
MTNQNELYYFLEDEFENLGNLKDVLEGMGEIVDYKTSLKHIMDTYVNNSVLDYNQVEDREFYKLEDGSKAALYDTDTGVFVISNSDFLSENSRALKSRAATYHIK